MTIMPREASDWAVDDVDRLPDDGLQYELLDGLLLVTPAPIPDHQRFARGIFRLLDRACPHGVEVFFAPLDRRPDNRTSLQPDVLVLTADNVLAENVTGPITLTVEVLSQSTRRKDLVLKHSKYCDAGVRSYSVVDPAGPSVTVWSLRGGAYVEVGSATGDEVLDLREPFPVRVRPGALVP